MKRIAIPISNERICTYFGQASRFLIFNIEGDMFISLDLEEAPAQEPDLWPDWLAEIGITDVIVKSMGRIAKYLLTQNKINVIDGISENRPSEFINNFLEKKRNYKQIHPAECEVEC